MSYGCGCAQGCLSAYLKIRQDLALSQNPHTLDRNDIVSDDEPLFDGNEHPPEFYRQGIEILNKNECSKEVDIPGTVSLVKYLPHGPFTIGPVPKVGHA